MGYERYSGGGDSQRDPYGRQDPRGYRSDRDDRYYGGRGADEDRGRYGGQDYGHARYEQRDRAGRDYYGGERAQASRDEGRGYRPEARGSEASGGDRDRQRGYGRQPQGYEYEDRGFIARAGDEVRSWFGDEDAERRREYDSRMDERRYNDRDDDYGNWRRSQIDALDRDYHEYRQENRSRFENEFSTWRTARQGQRSALGQVKEHMEVVGSDGSHVGTVDKVRGDRIILTKNDADAGGHHHSIPSRWIDAVADTVTLSKTADEAKQAWRDEDEGQAMFRGSDRDRGRDPDRDADRDGGRNLNKSFSGTY